VFRKEKKAQAHRDMLFEIPFLRHDDSANDRTWRVLPVEVYARFLVFSARTGADREGHVWTAPRRQGFG
jgi:hypothetical protein